MLSAMLRIEAIALFIVMSLPAITRAAPKAADLVRVDAIYDASRAASDHIITIGVRFRMVQGWHIYWKNAGDAGIPTTVTFDLPPNWTADEVEYPTPQVFKLPGDITDYGYEKEVMLLSVLHVPPGDPLTMAESLKVKAKYLVCERICIPGQATVDLNIDTGRASNSETHNEFAKWNSALPKAVAVEVKSENSDGGAELTVRGELGNSWSNDPLVFIPEAMESANVQILKVDREEKEFVAHLKVQPLPGQRLAKADRLSGLITQMSADGSDRRAVSFTVPLATGPTSRPNQ
jgi:DsbC/DsbD-like thiol-disulfide interchange protein